VYFSYLTSLTS